MQEKMFLFGTGKIAKKYTELLNEMSIAIEGYIDNDKDKWGMYFYNKKIEKPEILRRIEMPNIIIACANTMEISQQLQQMNLGKQIITIEHVIMNFIKKNKIRNYISDASLQMFHEKTVIIDNLNGTWGGAEDWSHIIACSLIDRGYHAIVIENMKQPLSEVSEENILRIDTDKYNEYHIYLILRDMLFQKKPFIFFNVRNSPLLWAAVTIKYFFPKEVKIISSILNDIGYEKFCTWDENIDLYLCISSRIQDNLVNQYKINKDKVWCCTPFIEKIKVVTTRYYAKNNEPLRIGYPCRLVCYQKRADLLPKLIMYLEKENINYVINIAGDGFCENEIREYVEKNNLFEKVKFYGKLSRKELHNFLDYQDIYLNFSEFEGTSLTMLEAMASGCVPVVTNVSGVSDFIEAGRNGLIADVGNLEEIANHISFLDKNRDKLSEYGSKCIDIVKRKCKIDNYIDNIEKMMLSL